MIETEGLTHVNLLVRDVHKAKAFYETVFGFQEMAWDSDRIVFLRPPRTQDTVSLQQSERAAGGAGSIDHIGFRLSDRSRLEAAIAEVIAAGGRLVERGEHAPGRPYAYVADLDGHVIEL